MSEFKYHPEFEPRKVPDVVSGQDAPETGPEKSRLPVNTYDDYKSWCDKVREEWDVN
ncbi:MAG: hypothetical protein HKN70_10530 [Gammaproteobacteria bacterium]|nr:hypothetical protein [Gammaproteobacteria bacterium]